MKHILKFLLLLLTTTHMWAQTPQSLSYQAVMRNSNNELISASAITIRISIVQGSESGNILYQETHNTNTNANGLVSLEIGTGNTSDNFTNIPWANGPFFVKTETDPTGGNNYTVTGTSPLLSVPYALYAENAGNSTPGPQGPPGLNGADGLDGATGPEGLSAYALAQNNGFVGTEAEWLTSLEAAQDISGITTNANAISDLQNEQIEQKTLIDLKAPLASPTFTGTPIAPTAAAGTNTTQIATTAFVANAVSAATSGTFVDLTTNQTIAGAKNFSSDLTVNGVLSAPTVMVENVTFSTGTWGVNQWQSFTATSSGVLTTISVYGNGSIGARTGTLTIYAGTGTSGAQLYSGSTALPPSSGWFDLTIGSSLSIVSGNIYTFQIQDQNPVVSPGGMVASENNLYTQGDYYSSVYGSNSGYDLTFKLWVSSISGGNISAGAISATGTISATAFVGDGSGLTGVATQTALDLKAPIASPNFTGDAKAETASAGDNDVSIATTAFVTNAVSAATSGTFVDLTTGQTIDGAKTFKENILVNYGTDGAQAIRIGAQGGDYNTMFGAATFLYGTPGSNNTAIGGFALASLNGGNENTAVGLNAIRQGGTADGSRNTAVGVAALSNGSGTNDNTAIGTYTLSAGITGGSNVAVGNYSLQNNTSANYNVGVGYESLRNTTTGGNNTAIGHGSMRSNTSGDVNTAVGENSLISNTQGRYNTAIGVQAQEQNTTGAQNTAIGVAAIDRNTAGNYNAVLGAFSGRYIADNSTYNTAIDNSVLVGALSRPLANNANNEIVIGYNAIGNGSNTVTLGNSDVTNVKTSGTITADAVTYPKAHGTNGQVLSTTGSGTLTWTTPALSKSIICKIADAPTTILSIGNYEFRYNSNAIGGFIEVRSSSSNDNMMVFCQKNTGSWFLNGTTSTQNYHNNTSVVSSWQPVMSLWNGTAWDDRVTLSTYDSFEAELFSMGNGNAIPNPLKSYKIFAAIDGYSQVFIKAECIIN